MTRGPKGGVSDGVVTTGEPGFMSRCTTGYRPRKSTKSRVDSRVSGSRTRRSCHGGVPFTTCLGRT